MKVLYGEEKEIFLKRAMIIIIVLLVLLFIIYFLKGNGDYEIPELYVKQFGYTESAKGIKEDYADTIKKDAFSSSNMSEVWKYSMDNTIVLDPNSDSGLVFFCKPVGKVKEDPAIVVEKVYAVETSTNLVSNSNKEAQEFNWISMLNKTRRSKNCFVPLNLTDNVVYILLVKVKYKHVGSVYYSFKLVNPGNRDIGDKYLENYTDTYILDTKRVNQILNLLPYANKLKDFEVNTSGKMTISYNCIANDKFIDYNSTVIFSLVPLLDKIVFKMSDKEITKNREDYSSFELKYNNVKDIMIKLYGTIEGSNYEN